MEKVCRTCLSQDVELIPLATLMPNMEDKTHLECLRSCTQMDIPLFGISEFEYPWQICVRCGKALQVAFHFIALAQNSEKNLCAREVQVSKMAKINMDRCIQIANVTQDALQEKNNLKCPIAPKEMHSEDCILSFVKCGEFECSIWSNANDENNSESMFFPLEYDENGNIQLCKNNNTEEEINFSDLTFEQDVLIEIENQSPMKILTPNVISGDDATISITNYKKNINNEIYSIAECSAELLTNSLEDQYVSDVDIKEIICIECEQSYSDMHSFIRHRSQHKGITPFRCNYCKFITCYAESLRKHYKKEHNIVASDDIFKMHFDVASIPMKKAYHDITYKCVICNFMTNKEGDIKMHLVKKHLITENLDAYVIKAFNCPDCYRTFKHQKAMRTHFTLMHGASVGMKKGSNELFACKNCGKQFKFKVSILAHQRACYNRESVNCNICNRHFISMRKFEQHLSAEHMVTTIHECETCGKTFDNAELLSKHRKRHTERKYQCEHCPRTYINNTELRVHMERIHSTKIKVKCIVCNVPFTHIDLLRKHQHKVHFKRLFKCHFCEYESSSRSCVRVHEYTHTGKPYQCEVCGKSFAVRAGLRRHAECVHSIKLSEGKLASMFRQKFGYPSRYDIFLKSKNGLEEDEICEMDIEAELKDFGLEINDIQDLFQNEIDIELNSNQLWNRK